MSIYYFGTGKLNEKDFPSNKKYIRIVKPSKPSPYNGKKRLTLEQREKYKYDMEQYNKCISLLESGHVDIYNNCIKTEDSDDFSVEILFNGIPANERIFKIKPIQSIKKYNPYRNEVELLVSEFDVEQEIKTTDELLDVLIENYDYYNLESKIFREGTYSDKKEKSFEIFKKLYEKTGNKYLQDLIHKFNDYEFNVDSYYDDKAAHDYAKELINTGYIKLIYEKDTFVWMYIIRLLKLKWTDFALEVIKEFINNEEQIKKIKDNKQIISLLSSLTDDVNVKAIVKLLGLKTNILTLIVTEDADDWHGTHEVERKEFSNMGELRSYLITSYRMPFEMASKNINDTYWHNMNFNIEQEN